MMRTTKMKVLFALLILALMVGCISFKKRLIVELPPRPAWPDDALEQSASCRDCHADIAKLCKVGKHAKKGVQCIVCHGVSVAHVEQETEGALPDRTWRRWIEDKGAYFWRMEDATLQSARFCASCHAKRSGDQKSKKGIDWDAFINSPHGRSLYAGSQDAPTCADCHRAHGTGAKAWTDESIVERCAECHASKSLTKRAGIDPDVIEDFKAGKHGSMRWVSAEKKTSCVKCHRPHG